MVTSVRPGTALAAAAVGVAADASGTARVAKGPVNAIASNEAATPADIRGLLRVTLRAVAWTETREREVRVMNVSVIVMSQRVFSQRIEA
jgi:hypothetical protein